MPDVIKTAALYLRETLESERGKKVRSSHAHAAVSGYLGFKSKKSLLADFGDHPIEDEHILLHIEPSEKSLSESISKMRNSPLEEIPTHILGNIIKTGLTPSCEQCGEKASDSSPVYTEDCENDPDGQVCKRCESFHDDEYAFCTYCGPSVIYRANQVNSSGECSVHRGESYMDDEERQGWEDSQPNSDHG